MNLKRALGALLVFTCLLTAVITPAAADDEDDWDTFQNRSEQYKTFPYRTTGVLTFSTPGGSAVCTATVVYTDMVMTAGHCLHPGGTSNLSDYYDDFVFCPAYRAGEDPQYGCWAFSEANVTDHWIFQGNGNVIADSGGDVGFIKVRPNDEGELPGDVVGWLPIQFNAPRDEVIYAQGYPAASPYSGNYQHLMNADYGGSSGSAPEDLTRTGGDWCRSGGSSGSPIVRNFTYKSGIPWNRPTHVNSGPSGNTCLWAYLGDQAKDAFFEILD